jgi:carboxypeptidase family protein
MRMLKSGARFVAFLVHCTLALLGHPSSAAAQCVEVHDAHMCRHIGPNTIVFDAAVESVEFKERAARDPDGFPVVERLVHLHDVHAVKGAPQDLLVAEVSGSEDCYYKLDQGHRYLIVAERRSDGRLAPSHLTRPLENSAGLRAYVQTLAEPAKGRQLWGNISMPSQWIEWAISYGPVPGARVTLQGPATRSTTTDSDGQYRFAKLPSGTYRIHVDLPGAFPYLEPITSQRVTLRAGSACAEIVMTASSRSRIEGVVVNEQGQPAVHFPLFLHPADFFDQSQGSPGLGVGTDARGHYEFSDLPPGRYVVGVGTDIGPAPGQPYVETYAALKGGETVVSLTAGGHVELEPLRLTRFTPTTISGSVLRADGSPAAGVEVSLWWTTKRGYERRTYPIKTDSAGWFRILASQEARYRLEVGPHENPTAHIAITTPSEPITITLAGR